ncbi:hypothetical protein ZHAS_00021097 [Anopheles sinensis]|uniref:Uncharacterized protein n=1 Tax=Anopheles sinensis TaxID=74873 RepID=A0A084WRI4_ANOSI|nr:hypothetical protein ZHAS_00021097 [Anopheles sinensis]
MQQSVRIAVPQDAGLAGGSVMTTYFPHRYIRLKEKRAHNNPTCKRAVRTLSNEKCIKCSRLPAPSCPLSRRHKVGLVSTL